MSDPIPAICCALDRQTILDAVVLGHGIVACGPLQRNIYNNENVEQYAYDPERAKRILEDAGCVMGAGFWHILLKHLTPSLVSSIMFMVVMNIRGAIASESTLSFIGIGLPLEVISWGSMLSQAERGLLYGCWWAVLIPGVFLVVTLLCITNIGNHLRKSVNRGESNL